MVKKKDNHVEVDITQLSVDELSQMNLDDILVYINEVDPERIKIYLIKIIKQIKQITDKSDSDSDHKLTKFRKRFRDANDLEEQFDEIYGLVEETKLFLNETLDKNKNEIELKLGRLKHKKLKEIEELQEKEQEIDYQTELIDYNEAKEDIITFFSKICTLYLNTMQETEDQERALNDLLRLLNGLDENPQFVSATNMGNAVEQKLQELSSRSKFNERDKMRKINAEKGKVFREETEKLKKEREIDRGKTKT